MGRGVVPAGSEAAATLAEAARNPMTHVNFHLPLLPSGPGGVRSFPSPRDPGRGEGSRGSGGFARELGRPGTPARSRWRAANDSVRSGGGRRREGWRREWDSNPRRSYPLTRFPVVFLRPLGHLSERISTDQAATESWRRGWDSNPRGALNPYPISSRARYDHFGTSPGSKPRPAWPRSGAEDITAKVAQGVVGGRFRRSAKNALRSAAAGSALMPGVTRGTWFSRPESGKSVTDPKAPAFGSRAA